LEPDIQGRREYSRGIHKNKRSVGCLEKQRKDHSKAMMDTLYSEMGSGRYNDYWVLNMGKP
jgi:hypothetical protein